jgi:DNA mismatch endonuclease (patch repair protein)
MKPASNANYWLPKIEGNRRRDAETNARLAAADWVAFRVWEHEDLREAADRLEAVLDQRRTA